MKVSKCQKIRNIQNKSSIAMCRGLLRASDKRSESASSSDSSNYASSFSSSRGSSQLAPIMTLLEVILNGNSVVQITKDEASNEIEVPPVTAQQILARTRERKAKSTLFMTIPDEHLARFHRIKDAKTLWAAIKTRFGGNVESKKMQKNVLKQQFEMFYVSNSEGLDKGSLPLAWSNISLIMRNKPGIDNLGIDDLYNNLKVYEADIKGSFRSFSNSQNVAFVFAESTSNTNELNVAYSVFIATGHSSQAQAGRKLEFNGKEPVGFDKNKVECFNCHRRGHFARDYISAKKSRNRSKDAGNVGYRGRNNCKRPAKQEDKQALVVQDGLGTYDWSYQVVEEATDFALMAFTLNPSSSSSLNYKVQSCSKQCEQSYEQLKTLFDEHREKLRKANIEIIGCQYGLESIEGQLHVHQKNEVIYEKKIGVLEYQVKDKSSLLKYTHKQLDEAGLGYDSQYNEKEVLDIKEEEVTKTVFDNRSSDEENRVANDRFKKGEAYHETDSDDDSVFTPKHIPAKIDFVKADRMAKKSVLPTNVGKGTGHMESRPVWNNVQRINHQNQFAPIAVFTRFGRIPFSAAKPKAVASTSAAKLVNTVGPKQSLKFSRTRSTFHKSHSPIKRSFYNATAQSRRNSTERVNTARSKAVSVVKGNSVIAVKTLTYCVWRPRVNAIDQLSKDNRWTCVDPQDRLKSGTKPILLIIRDSYEKNLIQLHYLMEDLKFVDQHNMVACLEKTKENDEFHQIVDFLSTCSINYALTISPTIYASYIEQFWNTAISKTVNSVKQIHAIVDGKAMVISESSVRSDLLFNDEDDEAVHQEGGDSVERVITTDASLVAAQDNDNIAKSQSTTMSIDLISKEMGSGHTVGSEADMMEKKTNLTDFVPPTPHDSPLRVETSTDKILGKDASKQGRNEDQTEKLNLINRADTEVIVEDKGNGEKGGSTADQVSTARQEVSAATPSTPPTTTTIFGDEDLTIAQTLIKMRSEKAKQKGVAFRDVE
uniref:Xylulose kinase-1 n=1 Tax=Tanacetum cinerariifolium TaxID=118510 RepID=A0A6L2K6D5_TANCI|nr:xylulose kinase-1 [Tanacetum cinerariifolium]